MPQNHQINSATECSTFSRHLLLLPLLHLEINICSKQCNHHDPLVRFVLFYGITNKLSIVFLLSWLFYSSHPIFWCNSSDPHCLLSLCLSLQRRVNKLSLVWTTNGCSWYDLPVYLVGIHENFCCGRESDTAYRLHRQELWTFFLFRISLGNHKKRKSRIFLWFCSENSSFI